MLFHIEIRGDGGWEAFGSGEGSGEDPLAGALADLTAVAGITLPEGEYRCIAAASDDARWESIRLDAEGRIVDPEVRGATRASISQIEELGRARADRPAGPNPSLSSPRPPA